MSSRRYNTSEPRRNQSAPATQPQKQRVEQIWKDGMMHFKYVDVEDESHSNNSNRDRPQQPSQPAPAPTSSYDYDLNRQHAYQPGYYPSQPSYDIGRDQQYVTSGYNPPPTSLQTYSQWSQQSYPQHNLLYPGRQNFDSHGYDQARTVLPQVDSSHQSVYQRSHSMGHASMDHPHSHAWQGTARPSSQDQRQSHLGQFTLILEIGHPNNYCPYKTAMHRGPLTSKDYRAVTYNADDLKVIEDCIEDFRYNNYRLSAVTIMQSDVDTAEYSYISLLKDMSKTTPRIDSTPISRSATRQLLTCRMAQSNRPMTDICFSDRQGAFQEVQDWILGLHRHRQQNRMLRITERWPKQVSAGL